MGEVQNQGRIWPKPRYETQSAVLLGHRAIEEMKRLLRRGLGSQGIGQKRRVHTKEDTMSPRHLGSSS